MRCLPAWSVGLSAPESYKALKRSYLNDPNDGCALYKLDKKDVAHTTLHLPPATRLSQLGTPEHSRGQCNELKL